MPEFTTIRSIAFPANTLEVTDNGEPHAGSVYLAISKIHGDESFIAVPAKELREAIDKAVGPAEGGYRASWLDACREQEETLARVNEVTFQRDTARKHLHDAEARVDELLAAQSRPVTVTDDALDRAQEAWEMSNCAEDVRTTLRRCIEAALTEPPARPEGAADIQRLVEEYTGPGGTDFADYLAERLTDPTAKGEA